MTILVDSDEFRAWHEVGHATVCLYRGGVLDGIEFLDGDARGHAVAHCDNIVPEMERDVACGGFAAEFYFLNKNLAAKASDDDRDIGRILLHNAAFDRAAFWERKIITGNDFSEAEDREFMNHAIGSDGHGGLIPIFNRYFSRMQNVVSELLAARKIDGARVKELLRLGIPR